MYQAGMWTKDNSMGDLKRYRERNVLVSSTVAQYTYYNIMSKQSQDMFPRCPKLRSASLDTL